jgi:polar amino acid transport system substrate-binding protein
MFTAGVARGSARVKASRVWCLVWAFLGLAPAPAQAQPIAVAAGEYSPFVAQQLPQFGVTAAIVTAAFESQGVPVRYDFLPWKRGYHETQLGRYVATFPYLKTPERESLFLYSEPIYTDRFRLFVRKSQLRQTEWSKKRLCIPLGYDTTQIQGFTGANDVTLERPPEISNCFQMLERERVDAIWVSELVAADTVRSLFGPTAQTNALNIHVGDESHYYLIVSKALPDANAWVSKFNAGLKHIRGNGSYQKIVQRFGGK